MIEYVMAINTDDLNVVDIMVQKMLKSLNNEELGLITECKTSKTIMEVIRNPDAVSGDLR